MRQPVSNDGSGEIRHSSPEGPGVMDFLKKTVTGLVEKISPPDELTSPRPVTPTSWVNPDLESLVGLEPRVLNGSLESEDDAFEIANHVVDVDRIREKKDLRHGIPQQYTVIASAISNFMFKKAGVPQMKMLGSLLVTFNQETSLKWPPPDRNVPGERRRFGALQMTYETARNLVNQYGLEIGMDSVLGRAELYSAYFSQAYDVMASKIDFSHESMMNQFPDFCAVVKFDDIGNNKVFALAHYHRAGFSRKYVIAQALTFNDIIARLPIDMLVPELARRISHVT